MNRSKPGKQSSRLDRKILVKQKKLIFQKRLQNQLWKQNLLKPENKNWKQMWMSLLTEATPKKELRLLQEQ